MARLLVLLACARGAAGIMDALDIKAVCEVAGRTGRGRSTSTWTTRPSRRLGRRASSTHRATHRVRRRIVPSRRVLTYGAPPVTAPSSQHHLQNPRCYGRDDVRVRRGARRRPARPGR